MLAGSQATKISKNRLNQLSTFGLLSQLKQSKSANLVDTCLGQDWIEQVELERFRPVTRLTAGGQEVMRNPVPPDVTSAPVGQYGTKTGLSSRVTSPKRPRHRDAIRIRSIRHTSSPRVGSKRRCGSAVADAGDPTIATGRGSCWRSGFRSKNPLTSAGCHVRRLWPTPRRSCPAGARLDPERLFSTEELAQLRQQAHTMTPPEGPASESAIGNRQVDAGNATLATVGRKSPAAGCVHSRAAGPRSPRF